MFYLGLNPDLINTNWPYFLLVYNLVISSLAGIFLFFTIKKLKRNQSREVLGSKFTWSFVKIIPILTIVPVLSFYIFSFQSIQETLVGLDKRSETFDKKIVHNVNIIQNNINEYVQTIYYDVTKANFMAIEGYVKYQIEQSKKSENQENSQQEVVI